MISIRTIWITAAAAAVMVAVAPAAKASGFAAGNSTRGAAGSQTAQHTGATVYQRTGSPLTSTYLHGYNNTGAGGGTGFTSLSGESMLPTEQGNLALTRSTTQQGLTLELVPPRTTTISNSATGQSVSTGSTVSPGSATLQAISTLNNGALQINAANGVVSGGGTNNNGSIVLSPQM